MCPEEHFRRTLSLRNFFFVFQTSSKNVRTMAKTIDCALLTAYLLSRGTFFRRTQEHFEENVVSQKNFSAKNDRKTAIFFTAFCKLQVTWLKHFFWSLFLTFGALFCQFQTFSKISSECLPKLLSMSPEDRSKIYGLKANNFRAFGQKVFSGVSNLHSTSPKKRNFKEEQFLEQTDGFSFQIRTSK